MENQLSTNSQEPSSQAATQEPAKKVKAKHGLKPFAFFSGLIDLIIAAAILLIGAISISSFFGDINNITDNAQLSSLLGIFFYPIIIIITAIFATAGILLLVLGILTIISSFKSDRRNYNGLLTTVIVFEVLLLIGLIILISSNPSDSVTLIILTAVLGVGLLFKIIDVARTHSRVKKYLAEREAENRKTYTGPNFDNLKKPAAGQTEAEPAKPEPTEAEAADGADQTQTGQSGTGTPNVDFTKLRK